MKLQLPEGLDKEAFADALDRASRMAEAYARRTGYRLNPSDDELETVLQGLALNWVTRGKMYCPCRVPADDPEELRKQVCPCAWHKEEIERDGHCHCRLFFRPEE